MAGRYAFTRLMADELLLVSAYEEAGFRPIRPMDTPWGHVLLMQKDNAS